MFSSALHLFFPARCVHCQALLTAQQRWLCPACVAHLILLCPENRCSHCFREIDTSFRFCFSCAWNPSLFRAVAAAFEGTGPASSLLHALKYQGAAVLSKTLAAYLVAQWSQLNWPTPDQVVAVPSSIDSWWKRGYDPVEEMGRELARFFSCPFAMPLRRKAFTPRQTKQTRGQRPLLPVTVWAWRKRPDIYGKAILLVDDMMKTGRTLQSCAQWLWEGRPRGMYALVYSLSPFS